MEERATYRVPETELFSVPLPMETRTYKPVSHRKLADITLEAIHDAGFKLDKQIYSSAREGNIANAKYTISDVADSEMQLQIGWQNSYDKTLSLKFAVGVHIFICANGCVSGDLGAFKKKHMGDVTEFAPSKIVESIIGAGDTFKTIQMQRDGLKEIEVDKKTRAELIGRMFIEQELITSSQLNIIKQQLKRPEFDYECADSLWELYNHTTYAMRELHPNLWMNNHIKLHKFFTETIDFTPTEILLEPSGTIIPELIVDPAQISILDQIPQNS